MPRVDETLRAKKKTPEQLAQASGLPHDRIQAILLGAEATMAELRSIAKALKVPVTDLLDVAEDPEPVQMLMRTGFFRQTPQPPPDAQGPLARVFSRVLELLGKYEPTDSWFDAVPEVEESYVGAERLSVWFRSRYCDGDLVGPLHHLPALAEERLGIPVIVGQSKIDGASVVKKGWPLVFVALRDFAPRMLFTLAHELGHMLIHHDMSKETAFVDERIEEKAVGKPKSEMQVDAFAATLLVPSQGLGVALQKIRESMGTPANAFVSDVEIIFLSRIFGVSFSVAGMRCEAVDLLPKGGAASLYEQIKKEYGSPEKKGDALGLPERGAPDFPVVSQALMDQAARGVRGGSVSIGRAAEILNTSIASVMSLNTPLH
jgi:Zn-dependent peptidase ImmA (M78 family)